MYRLMVQHDSIFATNNLKQYSYGRISLYVFNDNRSRWNASWFPKIRFTKEDQ